MPDFNKAGINTLLCSPLLIQKKYRRNTENLQVIHHVLKPTLEFARIDQKAPLSIGAHFYCCFNLKQYTITCQPFLPFQPKQTKVAIHPGNKNLVLSRIQLQQGMSHFLLVPFSVKETNAGLPQHQFSRKITIHRRL